MRRISLIVLHHRFVKNPGENVVLRQIIVASSACEIHPHQIFKSGNLPLFPVLRKLVLLNPLILGIQRVLEILVILFDQPCEILKVLLPRELKTHSFVAFEVDLNHFLIEQELASESKQRVLDVPLLDQ